MCNNQLYNYINCTCDFNDQLKSVWELFKKIDNKLLRSSGIDCIMVKVVLLIDFSNNINVKKNHHPLQGSKNKIICIYINGMKSD